MNFKWGNSRGGVALEYLIVTVFASVVALGAITAVSHWMKGKMEAEFSKMGVELPSGSFDFFSRGLDP
jgi:hypothetical protein